MDTTELGEYIEETVVRPYEDEDEENSGIEDYDIGVEDVELPEKVDRAIETMPHGESHTR